MLPKGLAAFMQALEDRVAMSERKSLDLGLDAVDFSADPAAGVRRVGATVWVGGTTSVQCDVFVVACLLVDIGCGRSGRP